MSEHRQALESTHDLIIETFGGTNDPVELEKLEGIADIGMRVAGFLQSEIADEGTWVDTGSDGEVYNCHVTVNGREYGVDISAGSTEAELDEWEAGIREGARHWDLLCPRVIEALRRSDAALADEFEAHVTPASVDTDPKGRDTK
jgi:hypothetical protein